jgi:membrane protease YdiL (CAAX protease family)
MRRSRAVRLLLFLLLAAGAFPLAGIAIGTLGVGGSGPTGMVWFAAVLSVLLVAATATCASLGNERLADLGFRASGRDLLAVGIAFGAGAALFSGVALVRGAVAGGTWQLASAAPVRTMAAGLGASLALMLGEELLFRGYAFQQARRTIGAPATIVVSALVFGLYHLLGTQYWAMGAVFRVVLPAAGGLVFGYALVRTGSMAVPIGLHWGGNWAQAFLLGLGQAPGAASAVWIMPLGDDRIRLLTAPDLLPQAPYLVAIAIAALAVRLMPPRLDANATSTAA